MGHTLPAFLLVPSRAHSPEDSSKLRVTVGSLALLNAGLTVG